VSVKLEAVSVVGSIATEKVAFGATDTGTPIVPSAGVRLVTVGVGGTVVNVHVVGPATATPSAALTVASMVAVYETPFASCVAGVSVAVRVVAS
jgi:hypothetical protein